ncbi:MAG: hypothetical protein AAGI48_04650 [Verrucomicrobiota bacterium]
MTNPFRNHRALVLLGLASVFSSQDTSASFLYSSYIEPTFAGDLDTEYSAWDVFYAPSGGENYPDFAAPYGSLESASDAGVTPPTDASPADPLAFWDLDNPTITQNSGTPAFIIGPGTPGSGNIYSFSGATGFVLNDSPDFSGEIGTVVFQFQTDGNFVDFDNIRLVYDVGGGDVFLPADEYVREYRGASSTFGGTGNRNALQWDLSGLGVDTYRIEFSAVGSSLSLQEAVVDTSAFYSSEVPEARTWNTDGVQMWGASGNWQEGSTSQENGNVFFANPAAVEVSDSTQRTVGELIFTTANDVTLNRTESLTVNTGISTEAGANGTYVINSDYIIGAFNLFPIESGQVEINGVISGDFGLSKTGDGTLVLKSNNNFGTGFEGVGVFGGTLRVEGSNTYPGSTAVNIGDLILAADAPSDAPGSLGDATTDVQVGSSSLSAGITTPARLIIDGDYDVARGILFPESSFDKRVGATGTSAGGALFSGGVTLQNFGGGSTDAHLFAETASDIATFSGTIGGGIASKDLEINAGGALGTVVFSGPNKTYSNRTVVRGGRFEIMSGTSMPSEVLIEPDTAAPAMLAGTGTLSGEVTVGDGGVLAPGNSVGSLGGASQIWNSGGSLEFEIQDADLGSGTGWDAIALTDTLTISATSGDPFTIDLVSLDDSGEAGPVADFSQALNYSWKIVGTTNGISGFDASAFTIDASGFSNEIHSGLFTVSLENGGLDLHLNFTASSLPLNLWLTSNFTNGELADSSISGLAADFDTDGSNTLLEYAFGTDPKTVDQPALLTSIEETGAPLTERLSLTFTRLLDRTDINYLVKAGNQPDATTATVVEIIGGAAPAAVNGGAVSTGTPSGNEQSVTASDSVGTSDAPARFMSIEIEKP